MKVLVTGGAGFLGSHVVDAFLAQGHEIAIVDHWQKNKKRFIPEGVHIVKHSIASKEAREFVAEFKPELVCHLAAQISVPFSVAHPAEDARINIVDAIGFLHACAEAGAKKIIYTSTCGVYGKSPDLPLNEESPRIPESPYALSKYALEEYLWYLRDMYGLQAIVFRPANAYGPRQQFAGEAGVVAIFLNHILKGTEAKVFGDGSATRDLLYAQDLARAFVLAAESRYQGVLNIGTGVEKTVKELWETLSDIHGQDTYVEYVAPRPGDIYRSYLDYSRAKEMIGWEPEIHFEEGLRRTYDWFKEHGI